MSGFPDNSCQNFAQLMKLAPEAIAEIDNLLKADLPASVVTRLNRIVAALYEISLFQDQIAKHLAEKPLKDAQLPEARDDRPKT